MIRYSSSSVPFGISHLLPSEHPANHNYNMTTPQDKGIAIIGAGLSGLCLALALHHENIPCEIYESRAEPLNIGGAIMLSPNALKILDDLGIYSRLTPLAYNFDKLYFRTEEDKLLDTFEFGSAEKHGYQGMRIYRFELIRVLLDALTEAGIEPKYGKKFIRVINEDAESGNVTWEFSDGTTGSAALLVGADGIHSRVRRHINAAATPAFMKMIAVTAAVPTAQLGVEDFTEAGYPLPVTIMNKTHGAFVIAPQRRDASEVLIGKQRVFAEDLDKAGWDEIINNKEWCLEFLRKGSEDYPALVGRAVSDIPIKSINLWPFYAIPKLASWTSEAGRVLILGDAAHAIPPTAGQGINQAFEDVYVFARVVGQLRKQRGEGSVPSTSALKEWQRRRQERVDRVLDLNARINKRRMPVQAGEELVAEEFDLRWLYDVNYDEMVENIVAAAA